MSITDVFLDPIFIDLVRRHELAVRRLREDVARLRLHHLRAATKGPQEDGLHDRWLAATLQQAAHHQLDVVRETAADLVRYGFELAPHSADPEHLAAISAAKDAHKKRLDERTGYGERRLELRGQEEKVQIDGGAPFTIVLKEPQKPAGDK